MLFVPDISGNARAFRSGMSNRAVPASSFLCQKKQIFLSPTLGDYRHKEQDSTMRCYKCGYENTMGATCVKCGTPLQNSDSGNANPAYQSDPADVDLHSTQIMDVSSADKLNLKSTVVQGAMPNLQGVQLKSTVIQSSMNDPIAERQLNSTVMQNNSSPLPLAHDDGNEKLECPKCGYPITASFNSCPNCGADFMEEEVEEEQPTPVQSPAKDKVGNATVSISAGIDEDDDIVEAFNICDKCKAEVPVEFSFCPHCGSKIVLKTIPSLHGRKKATSQEKSDKAELVAEPVKKICYLELIPEEGEEVEACRNSYEGTNIVLNRENTEKDNRTITSKEQAMLSFEDGKWFIENKSDFASTFIFAGRRLELNSGDVIMLGNRRFKFESE